MLGMITFLIGS
uniref:Uncharacterized protein n=1 Tax=Arundo donax TaxID=35708 RepID=A0A0A9H569_ARUDO